MVDHDLVILVSIGALDLLSDVLTLLVAHTDLLLLVAKLFDRLGLVALSKSEHRSRDYALKTTDEEVEQDHFHCDLLWEDVYVCIFYLELLYGHEVLIFNHTNLKGDHKGDCK